MGQYEKVGDSAKVLLRRGVCVLRVFFIYFVVVFLRRALFCKKSGHPILSLSFIHSFLFHSCAIRAQQSSPSTALLFKTSDDGDSSSCSNNNDLLLLLLLKTDPRQKRRGQQIEIFRHQRHGQFRGSLGVPENHRHRVRENYDGERVGDTKREKNART